MSDREFSNDDSFEGGSDSRKGRSARPERGGGRVERGGRGRDRDDRDDDDSSDSGDDRRRGGRRRRRGKTYYCPKGRCFDYKNLDHLMRFTSESGKIKPRRQTGNCSRCQRELAREVKRARHLALLPFVDRD